MAKGERASRYPVSAASFVPMMTPLHHHGRWPGVACSLRRRHRPSRASNDVPVDGGFPFGETARRGQIFKNSLKTLAIVMTSLATAKALPT